jgi:hypothetical protein
MRIPWNLRPRRHVAVTALVASLSASLAGAATAIACTPPAPIEGQISHGGMRVDAAPGGDAVVTWSEYRSGGPDVPRSAALMGGTWTWAEPTAAPEPDTRGLPSYTYALRAADAAGNGVAIWQEHQAVIAASRAAGEPFGTRTAIAPEDPSIMWGMGLGLGGAGHAIAMWTRKLVEPSGGEPTLERRVVRAADRAPDGTWSAPYDLAPPGAPTVRYPLTSCGVDSDWPSVAVDDAGNAVAVWESRIAEPAGIVTLWAARSAGGTWSAPMALKSGSADGVQLEMDGAGTAHALWIQEGTLRSARRPAGGAFGPSEVIAPAFGRVVLEVSGDGRALAVWQSTPFRLSAATRPAGGAWSAPVDLTALEKPAPPEPPVVRAPLLEGVALSRTTLRRAVPTVLRFRLGSAGEVKVIVQRRGRGKAVRGLRVAVGAGEHRIRLFASRPLPPGRYTVRVRVTSEGQASVTASTRLLVRPA